MRTIASISDRLLSLVAPRITAAGCGTLVGCYCRNHVVWEKVCCGSECSPCFPSGRSC
jgi:hypothetical protein